MPNDTINRRDAEQRGFNEPAARAVGICLGRVWQDARRVGSPKFRGSLQLGNFQNAARLRGEFAFE